MSKEIPGEVIIEDYNETLKEIELYRSEYEFLKRDYEANKIRMYIITGRIHERKDLLKKIRQILIERGLGVEK